MKKIDLNCDMGESFGSWIIGNDEAIMPFISSANIACGFHAGDASVMKKTCELVLQHHVAIGAHVGFPDLQGFGRRNMGLSTEEVYDICLYQIGALYGILKSVGGTLYHVKPHGALYNMAAKNKELAAAIAKSVYDFDKSLVLYGLSGSYLITEAQQIGLSTASEVFADRTYQDDGSLTPRTMPNSLIKDETMAIEQVLEMINKKEVISINQKQVAIKAETVCIHGDGAFAAQFVLMLNKSLKQHGIVIQKPI